MKRTLTAVLLSFGLATIGFAQNGTPIVVPVEQAPYHVPVFHNDLVTVLDVFIPPKRESGYHRHSLDTVGVLIADTERTGQVLGAERTVTAPRERGSINFGANSRQENVHTVAVTGDTPFHNIVVELMAARPSGFTVSTRGSGYEQILDNERVRAWRLALDPGESAPAITQSAPGVRVVVMGGELIESVPGRPDRAMAPRPGDFFWQDPGATRAVRNSGSSRLDIVEIEIK
jgi:hypothetical protein